MEKKKINVVYPIGIRCYTNGFLTQINLIRFSSIFSSMNIKNSDNFIKCITNMDVLFNESNLVYTKNIKEMAKENETWGLRTLHRLFDDISDFHSATIAHHDLSNIEVKNHFKRGVERLDKIKHHNIPILFVQISHVDEYNNSIRNDELAESVIKAGFNGVVLSVYYFTSEKSHTMKEGVQVYENQIILCIETHVPYGQTSEENNKKILSLIEKYFDVSNLMSIDDIDNLII